MIKAGPYAFKAPEAASAARVVQKWACWSWFSELTFGVLLVCRAAKRRPKEAGPEQVAPETPEDRDEDERVSALPLPFLP